MNKKILLLLMAFGITGMIASAATKYEINVGGVEVTSDNKNNVTGGDITVASGHSGYVKYDPSTNTLTLYNIEIERTGSGDYAVHNRKCDNLTIKIMGSCHFISDKDAGMKLQRNTTIYVADDGTNMTAALISGGRNNGNWNGKPAIAIDNDRTLTFDGTRGTVGQENLLLISGGNASSNTNSVIQGGSSITFKGDCKIDIDMSQFASSYQAYVFCNQTINFQSGCDVNMSADRGVVYNCNITLGSGLKVLTPYNSPYTGYTSSGFFWNNNGSVATKAHITNHYLAVLNSTYFPDNNFRNILLNMYYGGADLSKGYITEGDVTRIDRINVNNENISNLQGIQYFTYLTELECQNNSISSLNVSTLTKLRTLNCSNNSISSLNLNNNTQLYALYCYNNSLTSLNLNYNTQLAYFECYNNQISSISNFPSPLMVINCKNNKLTSSLNLGNRNNLVYLDARNNPNLTTIDTHFDSNLYSLYVSGCSSLELLNCYGCKLTNTPTLDVSGCTKLQGLNCYDCSNLTAISGLGTCTSLKVLDCHNTKISSLTQLSGTLQDLYCYNTNLTGYFNFYNSSALRVVNLSNNPKLTEVNVFGNSAMTMLNVSGCSTLTAVDCSNCKLTSLTVNNCPAMTSLDCYLNQLSSLSLSGCSALQSLDCSSNNLTSISYLPSSLKHLWCSYNKFTGTFSLTYKSELKTLAINNNPSITTLNCNNNSLTSLNVAGCTGLTSLDCHQNQITSLDVSTLSNLTLLYCYDNKLTSLNVANKTKLGQLQAYRNQLTSINVQGCSALQNLGCAENKLSSLSVQGCNALTTVNFWGNQIKESAMTSFINTLRTIPAGSTGELDVIYPGQSIEGNVITDAQIRTARNKRWIPKKYVSGTGWVEIPVSSAIPGDVDGDGIVTSVDVTILYNYLLNGTTEGMVNGDQDGDGIITSVDVTIIYNILLGN